MMASSTKPPASLRQPPPPSPPRQPSPPPAPHFALARRRRRSSRNNATTQRQIRNNEPKSSSSREAKLQEAAHTMTFRSQKLENDRRILIVTPGEEMGDSFHADVPVVSTSTTSCVRGLNIPITMGMEKEEETEVHLVRALESIGFRPSSLKNDCLPEPRQKKLRAALPHQAFTTSSSSGERFAIPTPVCEVRLDLYESIYGSAEFVRRPASMRTLNCRCWYGGRDVTFGVTITDPDYPVYDADFDDQEAFGRQSLNDFERVICELETRGPEFVGGDDELVDRVIEHWTEKKSRIGQQLIPRLRIGTVKSNAADPYIVFRRRQHKMQTRKKQNLDAEERLGRTLVARTSVCGLRTHMDLMRACEREKREVAHLNLRVLKARIRAIRDGELVSSGQLLLPPRSTTTTGIFKPDPSIPAIQRRSRLSEQFESGDESRRSGDSCHPSSSRTTVTTATANNKRVAAAGKFRPAVVRSLAISETDRSKYRFSLAMLTGLIDPFKLALDRVDDDRASSVTQAFKRNPESRYQLSRGKSSGAEDEFERFGEKKRRFSASVPPNSRQLPVSEGKKAGARELPQPPKEDDRGFVRFVVVAAPPTNSNDQCDVDNDDDEQNMSRTEKYVPGKRDDFLKRKLKRKGFCK